MKVCKYCHCQYTGDYEIEPVEGSDFLVKMIYPPWVVDREIAEPSLKPIPLGFICCCPCHFIDNPEYLKAVGEILGVYENQKG